MTLAPAGLATLLRDRQTHLTSQLKGTTDFMPPGARAGGALPGTPRCQSVGLRCQPGNLARRAGRQQARGPPYLLVSAPLPRGPA